jgi:hypothetical protein
MVGRNEMYLYTLSVVVSKVMMVLAYIESLLRCVFMVARDFALISIIDVVVGFRYSLL